MTGPRQVGKSTLVQQVTEGLGVPVRYASADEPALRGAEWIGQQWGRLVESAVGSHLANAAAAGECELFYWRERNFEVDFVVKAGRSITAIEVKSGRAPLAHAGTAAFTQVFTVHRTLLVGGDGVSVEAFLSQPVAHWVEA